MDTINYMMNAVDIHLQTRCNCKILFSAMNDCIKENSKRGHGTFASFSKQLPTPLDLTKCSQYNDFVANNNVILEYNLDDAKCPYNTHYDIYWNEATREMNVKLNK